MAIRNWLYYYQNTGSLFIIQWLADIHFQNHVITNFGTITMCLQCE